MNFKTPSRGLKFNAFSKISISLPASLNLALFEIRRLLKFNAAQASKFYRLRQ
ncbi:hypothetical protein CAMGR0001_0224 [Campylobacter gracilis RM3268]|uniref:Uncharacterized protein n=1 Tax=Campylobacter gracilis RM3268 TaxID=553220 RepID=C8PKK2_9BACT|nr:hypothetical protein CAMGR0001_0224 [Campylobacter gracilis RM3268]